MSSPALRSPVPQAVAFFTFPLLPLFLGVAETRIAFSLSVMRVEVSLLPLPLTERGQYVIFMVTDQWLNYTWTPGRKRGGERRRRPSRQKNGMASYATRGGKLLSCAALLRKLVLLSNHRASRSLWAAVPLARTTILITPSLYRLLGLVQIRSLMKVSFLLGKDNALVKVSTLPPLFVL